MKKLFPVILFFVLTHICSAQKGFPLLTHFNETRESENQSWAICQDENQVMLFANRKGILTFDGQDWEQAPITVVPWSMRKNPADGKIYIGGENNFGYIDRDPEGRYKYISLSGDSLITGSITKIIFSDSILWFYSDQVICRYNLKTKATDLVINAKQSDQFTGMFVTPHNTFINVFRKGLYRLESDTLFPIVTGYMTENVEILFALPYSNTQVLTGFSNGRLSLFDGIIYSDYPVKDEGYLGDNILSEGLVLGDTAYAFSTLDGGALVVEKKSGELLFTINNQIGLPDDEVFATGDDNSGGLWLSHQYGLTRADLTLPVRDFSTYPGLYGNLSSALRHKDELYVSSSEGVYYLTEVKSYDEIQVVVRSEKPEPVPVPDLSPVAVLEQQPARRGILSKIFGGRSTQTTIAQQDASVEVPVVKPAAPLYTRKTISKLRSINHVYKKVSGLNEKCRQIVSTPYGILAATNKGLYVINDKAARIIVPDRYINSINWSQTNNVWFISANNGYFSVRHENGKWLIETPDPGFNNSVFSVLKTDDRTFWLGGDNRLFKGSRADSNESITYTEYKVNNHFPQRYYVEVMNDTILLFTETGIFYYEKDRDAFSQYSTGSVSLDPQDKFERPLSNRILVNINDEWRALGNSSGTTENELSVLKIFDDVLVVYSANRNLWVISGDNRLYNINREMASSVSPAVNIMIKNISNNKGTSFSLSEVKFNRGDDIIVFDIVVPGYLKRNITQYQYFIDKVMDDWSAWSVQTHYERPVRRSGEYRLQVRAKDIWGNIGEPRYVDFTIKAPFTRTALFYILCFSVLLLIFVLILRFREKQLQIKNRILEEKVKERTAEIEAQKEEITSSIEYASRIQHAMLPMEDHFRDFFADYFIFFRPRDIVSGDFYWIGENDKSVFVTVADCTGHGVPGAFMSTLGISTLYEIIANNENLQADKVLNLLRHKIKTSLHQTGKEGEAVDGMDISLCAISKNRKVLQFAGAYNTMVMIRNGELKEYRGDSMPIGIHYGAESPFTNHEVKLAGNDCFYLFSDGFPDQFGGPEGAKYKKAKLKKLLLEIHNKPMEEQKLILEKEFLEWKGSSEQIDDITVLGIRF